MPFYPSPRVVEFDENGLCDAMCSVCFQDKRCLSITYPKIQEICERFNIPTYAFAVCEKCRNTSDKRWLCTNIMDFFIINELARWTCGDKKGIIHSNLEFKTLLNIAKEQGIIYREEKRINRFDKRERPMNAGFLNILKREGSDNYNSNTLYQSLFKHLYDG